MTIRAQVIFPSTTGLPKDATQNTFHFTGLPDITNATFWALELQNFYNVTHAPGPSPLADELSPYINRTGCSMKFYDALALPPQEPILTWAWTLAGTGAQLGQPGEVALVLSYQAEPVAGVSARRTRGRIFIGPLNTANMTQGSGDARPGGATINKMKGAGSWLAGRTSPTGDVWCVYSKAQGQAYDVTRGWVDDAFDTQRRRGKGATTRNTWVAV
jgi:hypothetical protein